MKQTAIEYLVSKIASKIDNEYWSNQQDITEYVEQAKAMEKEQMIKFAEFVATYPDKNKNANGDILHAKSKYDGAERTVDLLETFKQQDL